MLADGIRVASTKVPARTAAHGQLGLGHVHPRYADAERAVGVARCGLRIAVRDLGRGDARAAEGGSNPACQGEGIAVGSRAPKLVMRVTNARYGGGHGRLLNEQGRASASWLRKRLPTTSRLPLPYRLEARRTETADFVQASFRLRHAFGAVCVASARVGLRPVVRRARSRLAGGDPSPVVRTLSATARASQPDLDPQGGPVAAQICIRSGSVPPSVTERAIFGSGTPS